MGNSFPTWQNLKSIFCRVKNQKISFRGISGTKKLHSFLNLVLVLSMGLFFYFPDEKLVYAGSAFTKDNPYKENSFISLQILDPLNRIPQLQEKSISFPMFQENKKITENDKTMKTMGEKPLEKKEKKESKEEGAPIEDKSKSIRKTRADKENNSAHQEKKGDQSVKDKIGEFLSPKLEEKKEETKVCQEELADVTSFSQLEIKETKEEDKSKKDKYLSFVKDYPIAEMVPYISQQDKTTAAFLIGIAKKESDWGKHSPSKNGRNCYNYWGYKGGYNLTSSGYSCFDSPEQAVEEVGGRITELINKDVNTPQKMLVWKCGASCAGHDPEGVRKWVSDVSLYFYKLVS